MGLAESRLQYREIYAEKIECASRTNEPIPLLNDSNVDGSNANIEKLLSEAGTFLAVNINLATFEHIVN